MASTFSFKGLRNLPSVPVTSELNLSIQAFWFWQNLSFLDSEIPISGSRMPWKQCLEGAWRTCNLYLKNKGLAYSQVSCERKQASSSGVSQFTVQAWRPKWSIDRQWPLLCRHLHTTHMLLKRKQESPPLSQKYSQNMISHSLFS